MSDELRTIIILIRIFGFIPSVCTIITNRIGNIIENIPMDLRSFDVCENAVNLEFHTLQYVPNEYATIIVNKLMDKLEDET